MLRQIFPSRPEPSLSWLERAIIWRWRISTRIGDAAARRQKVAQDRLIARMR